MDWGLALDPRDQRGEVGPEPQGGRLERRLAGGGGRGGAALQKQLRERRLESAHKHQEGQRAPRGGG